MNMPACWPFGHRHLSETRRAFVGAVDCNSRAPVPEPESWAMLMAGLGLIGFAARKRQAK